MLTDDTAMQSGVEVREIGSDIAAVWTGAGGNGTHGVLERAVGAVVLEVQPLRLVVTLHRTVEDSTWLANA